MGVFYRFQDSGLDDWKQENNYVQMGFRPGFAIQARELTQLQTFFQYQLDAIARSAGLNNGSLISPTSNVSMSRGNNNNWSITINPSEFFIRPALRDFGYVVNSTSLLQLSSININPAETTHIYLVIEETQVNPNGDEYPPGGGYAKVTVNEELNDNAQGFTNSSAPGASRYSINILDIATRVEGEGNPPPNSIDFITFTNGFPYYSSNGNPVTY